MAGCQEVQGACLEGCLGKACGAFGGFERFAAALNARKNRGLRVFGLKKPAQGGVALKCCKRCKGPAWRVALERLEGLGFEDGQTAALNALKNRWPWWLAAKRCKGPAWRVALERLAERLEGLRGLRQPRTRVKTDGRGVFGLEKPAQGGVALKCCKRCKGPAWKVGNRADCLEGLRGRVALKRLAEGLEGLRGKRQPRTPLETDGRGGWLPRGARGLLGGLPWKGLRKVWRV